MNYSVQTWEFIAKQLREHAKEECGEELSDREIYFIVQQVIAENDLRDMVNKAIDEERTETMRLCSVKVCADCGINCPEAGVMRKIACDDYKENHDDNDE